MLFQAPPGDFPGGLPGGLQGPPWKKGSRSDPKYLPVPVLSRFLDADLDVFTERVKLLGGSQNLFFGEVEVVCAPEP